jgi:hypothetical protein
MHQRGGCSVAATAPVAGESGIGGHRDTTPQWTPGTPLNNSRCAYRRDGDGPQRPVTPSRDASPPRSALNYGASAGGNGTPRAQPSARRYDGSFGGSFGGGSFLPAYQDADVGSAMLSPSPTPTAPSAAVVTSPPERFALPAVKSLDGVFE